MNVGFIILQSITGLGIFFFFFIFKMSLLHAQKPPKAFNVARLS